ncbi:MAG: hypothetical protein QXX95_06260 [Nitrososphaerales archaeon]
MKIGLEKDKYFLLSRRAMYSGKRCPLCSSEVRVGKDYYYCTNPNCNYSSNFSSKFERDIGNLAIRKIFLPFSLLVLGLLIVTLVLSFFLQYSLFLFIPLIFPFAFLKRFNKRRKDLKYRYNPTSHQT